MIFSTLEEGAVTHKTCKKWVQRFCNSDFDLFNRERPGGQPTKFEDEELDQLLEENPAQTEKQLTHTAGETVFGGMQSKNRGGGAGSPFFHNF